MKRFICTALLICMALSLCLLTGCGEKYPRDCPVLGKWTAAEAEALGKTADIDSSFDGEFTIDAKASGKASVVINGESGECDFSFEGNVITLILNNGSSLSGRLEGGRLCFEDLDGSGITLYFTKTA